MPNRVRIVAVRDNERAELERRARSKAEPAWASRAVIGRDGGAVVGRGVKARNRGLVGIQVRVAHGFAADVGAPYRRA